jgi:acyl-CoA thioester hydrolase
MEMDTPATEFLVTYRGTVYPWHCDHMGHMNVASYVSKFDEASWQLMASLGLTNARFRQERIGMATVEQRVDYKRELHAGDVVTVRSAVLRITNRSIHVTHQMQNDDTGELVASTSIIAVHIDSTTRRARPFPVDVHERAMALIGGRQCVSLS